MKKLRDDRFTWFERLMALTQPKRLGKRLLPLRNQVIPLRGSAEKSKQNHNEYDLEIGANYTLELNTCSVYGKV